MTTQVQRGRVSRGQPRPSQEGRTPSVF